MCDEAAKLERQADEAEIFANHYAKEARRLRLLARFLRKHAGLAVLYTRALRQPEDIRQ